MEIMPREKEAEGVEKGEEAGADLAPDHPGQLPGLNGSIACGSECIALLCLHLTVEQQALARAADGDANLEEGRESLRRAAAAVAEMEKETETSGRTDPKPKANQGCVGGDGPKSPTRSKAHPYLPPPQERKKKRGSKAQRRPSQQPHKAGEEREAAPPQICGRVRVSSPESSGGSRRGEEEEEGDE
uniref:Uncharacterized protein n=1 Tax=Oryza meridionalis TaxID=40149 RepID=A0A0E0DJJ4_9ORYZ